MLYRDSGLGSQDFILGQVQGIEGLRLKGPRDLGCRLLGMKI